MQSLVSVIFWCTCWFSPVLNPRTSVQCLSLSRMNQSRRERQRWDRRRKRCKRFGLSRGVQGGTAWQQCHAIPSWNGDLQRLPTNSVCWVGGDGPRATLSYSLTQQRVTPVIWEAGLELLGLSHAWGAWGTLWNSSALAAEGLGSPCSAVTVPLGALMHVGRAGRERRPQRDVQLYAQYFPLPAGSHLLQSVGVNGQM